MTTEDALKASQRLGEVAKARRLNLELTQKEVASLARIGLSTYQKVEYGYPGDLERDTRRGIEAALRWAPGSVKAVLDGGEAKEISDGDPAPITVPGVGRVAVTEAPGGVEREADLAQLSPALRARLEEAMRAAHDAARRNEETAELIARLLGES